MYNPSYRMLPIIDRHCFAVCSLERTNPKDHLWEIGPDMHVDSTAGKEKDVALGGDYLIYHDQ